MNPPFQAKQFNDRAYVVDDVGRCFEVIPVQFGIVPFGQPVASTVPTADDILALADRVAIALNYVGGQ